MSLGVRFSGVGLVDSRICGPALGAGVGAMLDLHFRAYAEF